MPRTLQRREWGAVGSVAFDPMPKTELSVHHDTSPNRQVWTRKQKIAHLRAIEAQHISQGWSTIGYSWLVFPDGMIAVGRGRGKMTAAVMGENSGMHALCFVGNFETGKPTVLARRAARRIIRDLMDEPGADLKVLGGHSDWMATACPGKHLQPYVIKWRKEFKLRKPA